MSLRIAYTRPDGGVSIVSAAPKADIERVIGPMTAQEYLAHVLSRSIPSDATDVNVLPLNWTPPDGTFRNAWRQVNGIFSVDMPTAREIWRDKMRARRRLRFEILDALYLQADEQSNLTLKQQIAAKKQELRDITALPEIDAAQTTTDLKAVWPTILDE